MTSCVSLTLSREPRLFRKEHIITICRALLSFDIIFNEYSKTSSGLIKVLRQ